MRMLGFSVAGFRNLNKTTICLSDINALVALNNYGKSNLFTALDFGVDFIDASNEGKSRMMNFTTGIPLNKSLESDDFYLEIEVEFSQADSVDFASGIYTYSFRWPKNDDSGCKIVSESLKLKLRGDKRKYEQFIKRIDDDAMYKSSSTGRCSQKISIADNGLVINKLVAQDALYYHNVLTILSAIKVRQENSLDVRHLYDAPPFIFKNSMEFDNDLPATMAYLKEKHGNLYEVVRSSFLQLFPSIEDIVVAAQNQDEAIRKGYAKMMKEAPFTLKERVYHLFVVDKNLNQPINFRLMSDGAKRVLVLLSTVAMAELSGYQLISIEEPENSIHPTLLHDLITIIDELRGNCQVLFASHSPYLVRYLDLKDVYFGIPNDRSIACFKNIQSAKNIKKILKAADKYDMNIGEYCLTLLSEVHTDEDLLQQLFGSDVV